MPSAHGSRPARGSLEGRIAGRCSTVSAMLKRRVPDRTLVCGPSRQQFRQRPRLRRRTRVQTPANPPKIIRDGRECVPPACETDSRPAFDFHNGTRRHPCRHPGRLPRSEEHTSELQSQFHLVCRLLLEKKKKKNNKKQI